MDETTFKRIEGMVKANKVFLFMKGTPETPMCGFSARTVEILKQQKIDFKSFDVLSDEDIRQGIKEYSNWPTIPQLYIDGKFVGGCDITEELSRKCELKKLAIS